MKANYDKSYFQGDTVHLGSDLIKKYDIHWWSFRYYSLLIKSYLKNGVVLDLGCAHGYLLGFLENDKYTKKGIDISDYALKIAKSNNPEGTFVQGNVEDLSSFKKESVDLVISKYVLEHLNNPDKAISEVNSVLKEKGYFIFSVPNTSSVFRLRKGENWIGDRDKTHLSVFTPEKWEELLVKNGFTIVKSFSDGFWDVPYFKYIPNFIQLIFIGFPSILQTFLGLQVISVKYGENLIMVARKN